MRTLCEKHTVRTDGWRPLIRGLRHSSPRFAGDVAVVEVKLARIADALRESRVLARLYKASHRAIDVMGCQYKRSHDYDVEED